MKKTTIFLLIIILFASCSDDISILKEKPKAIAAETFYNNAEEIEAGILAIYDPFRDYSVFGAQYISFLDCSSDQIKSGRGSWLHPSQFDGINTEKLSGVQWIWVELYRSIRNGNVVLQRVQESDLNNKYIGEAKFLRALAYFHLVRNFGAVPLRTEDNIYEVSLPRSSVEDVFKFIISDLEFAEDELPDEPKWPGRACKWSAKTVLADVYFSLGEYNKAASKADEVIKSRKYSLVEVSEPEDFEKLFGATVVNSSEEIFYFKFSKEDRWSHPIFLHGVGTPYIGLDGYYVTQSNEDYSVYKNWDNNDLRKIYGWYPYDGHDPGTVLSKKFNDPGSLNPSNDYPLYRYADLLLIYAEASCRDAGNPTIEGMEALNQVHRRAYGYPSTQNSPVDFNISDFNRDDFIEICIKERGYETQSEGKRWFDLKRLGKEKASEIIMATRGLSISEKHWLWPIPPNEIDHNDLITEQNPGY